MPLTTDLSLAPFFTFEPSKSKPIYNWFYYKEAFSPEIVEWALKKEGLKSGFLYDPFSGIGTSVLYAKSAGLQSAGSDVSPVAVLAGRVKTADYTADDLVAIRQFLDELPAQLPEPANKWDFELFSPRAVFPRSNYTAIVSLRELIESIQNGKARSFLLLALLSILPQTSLILKDGGVLKIDKRKSAMPAKEAFRKKVKTMLRDLETHPIAGPVPSIQLSDARSLPAADNSADIMVTSPPYLNNVDYSKVYGLEISLMYMDKSSTKAVRSQSIRSFITNPPSNLSSASAVPPEAVDIASQIPVAGIYFADMEAVLQEIQRVLKPGAACYFVVANSVIHTTEIIVDELLVQMAQRLGMQADIVVGAERIAYVRPRKVKTRESVVIFRKPGITRTP